MQRNKGTQNFRTAQIGFQCLLYRNRKKEKGKEKRRHSVISVEVTQQAHAHGGKSRTPFLRLLAGNL